MAFRFNYNKTTIQQFQKQLAIREKALPILKNKETALRKEVKDITKKLEMLVKKREQLEEKLEKYSLLWSEFPSLLTLEDPGVYEKKIIGVKVPDIGEIRFRLADVSWWNLPAWIPSGIELLQEVIRSDIHKKILTEQVWILDLARKKTTQKVNLYEKVQIPAYEEAILKIKRFLEDKENISKAGQKIMKKRKERKQHELRIENETIGSKQ